MGLNNFYLAFVVFTFLILLLSFYRTIACFKASHQSTSNIHQSIVLSNPRQRNQMHFSFMREEAQKWQH
jgi:hypothetical protein